MKGQRFLITGVRKIELVEFDIGPLPDDGILVEHEWTAVSVGTEIYGFAHGADPGEELRFPRKTGYCSAGTVVDVGSAVTDIVPGDRVAGQGGHGSHSVMTDQNLYQKVPAGIPTRTACFLVMAAISMRGVRVARIELGESVVVMGLGLVGQLAASLAAVSGGVPVIGVDLNPFRLELAQRRGIDVLDGADSNALAAAVSERCWGSGADVVIEATGKPGVYPTALGLAAYAGRVVALGNPRGMVSIDLDHDVMRREVRILGAPQPRTPDEDHIYYRFTRHRDRSLVMSLMAEGRLPIDDLITSEEEPSRCQDVYSRLTDDPSQMMGVVFNWQGPNSEGDSV